MGWIPADLCPLTEKLIIALPYLNKMWQVHFFNRPIRYFKSFYKYIFGCCNLLNCHTNFLINLLSFSVGWWWCWWQCNHIVLHQIPHTNAAISNYENLKEAQFKVFFYLFSRVHVLGWQKIMSKWNWINVVNEIHRPYVPEWIELVW